MLYDGFSCMDNFPFLTLIGDTHMRISMAVALLLLAPMMMAAAADKELKVGDPAPDFQMKGSDGKTYKLSDFKGKQAFVIAWFPKAFTGG